MHHQVEERNKATKTQENHHTENNKTHTKTTQKQNQANKTRKPQQRGDATAHPSLVLFRRPLPFGGSRLRLPSGPAGIRTTTGSLSALARPTPYQLSHRVAYGTPLTWFTCSPNACLNLSTCIESKPCIILRISIRSANIRSLTTCQSLSFHSCLIWTLTQVSVLDLKHMAFLDHRP